MKDFDGFEFDQEFFQKLEAGDKAAEAYFGSYYGALLCIKLRRSRVLNGHINDLKEQILVRSLAAIRSGTGLDYGGHLGSVVIKVCRQVLRESQAPPTGSRSPAGLFADKLSEAKGQDVVWATDLVRQVLDELSDTERQLLRDALGKNRGSQEARKDSDSGNDLPLLLCRAKKRLLLHYKQSKTAVHPQMHPVD